MVNLIKRHYRIAVREKWHGADDRSRLTGWNLRWRSRRIWTARRLSSISGRGRCTLSTGHRSAMLRWVIRRRSATATPAMFTSSFKASAGLFLGEDVSGIRAGCCPPSAGGLGGATATGGRLTMGAIKDNALDREGYR